MSAPSTAHTVVQSVGDRTTLAAGHPHLTLTRTVGDTQAQRSLDWLSASARAAPLVGRTQDIQELKELLLGNPRPILAQVITGSMGRGKTRLAMELIDWASANGWCAGFAQSTEAARFLAQPDLQGWGWQQPTLVVIDNAAQHTQGLASWLQILSQRPADGAPPLRLLLLERQASLQHGWCALMLAGTSHVASRKRALLEPPEPVELAPLSSDEDCLTLLAGFKSRLSPGETPDPAPGRALLRALRTGQQDCDPLHLMMAALTYEQSGAVALRRARLATGLARGEAQRITELSGVRGFDARLVLHLAACVTLAQGLPRGAVIELAAKEAQALELSCDAEALTAFLAEVLPGTDGGVAPLVPEIIGEAFVLAQELPRNSVLACYTLAPGAVTRTAVRCAEDLRSLGGTLPLTWLAALLEDRPRDNPGDEQALAALAAAMSPDSSILASSSLQVAKEWLRVRTEAAAPATSRAAALQHLARSYARAGEPQEGLAAARQAAAVYSEVARASEEARLDAAAPLSHLAALFEELGAAAESITVSQQVVSLYRELEAKHPGTFTRELADALYSLAARLGANGTSPAAIEPAQEARLLYQGLAAAGHVWAPPALARCLLTVARLQREQQRPPAIQATREAVELLRVLAARRPSAFGAMLAEALTVLASLLASEVQHGEAVMAAQEAIRLYRDLSGNRPYPFAPRLAEALMVLAGVLGSQQHPESALQAAQEAALLNRELATFRPGLRAPLAASLRCVASLLQQLRRHYGAILAQEEAVQLYRDLTIPATDGRIDLATSLTHLARMQSEQGHLEAALATTLEATAVYRELDALRQSIFRSALATSLGSLARLQAEAGQRETAVTTAREAIMIRRALAAQRPTAQRPALASALAYLSSLLKGLRLRDAALPVAWEVTELYRALASERPAAFQPQLAAALDTLCDLLTGNDEWQAALVLANESLAVRRALAAARPAMFRGELAELLARLARIHHALGDSDNALESVRQALNLYAELAAAQPTAFRPGLAAAQNTLALLLADAGRREEALVAAEEALAAYRELGEQHPGMFQEALASALDVLATVRGAGTPATLPT